ncbi:MAG TPA: hypothetical protein VFO86_12370 [Terriglobia bacterium]|nr:hypothetical protein [Terriglobia bacterium]
MTVITHYDTVRGIMRNIAGIFAAVVALIVFLAVVSFVRPQTFFSGQRFVSEDNSQTLELRVNSRLGSVIPAVGGSLSGGRLFGKRQGSYILTTPQGRTSGEFVWMKGPLCCRELPDQTLAFWPDSGKQQWSVAVADGSFQDSTGMAWKLKTPK